jgi:hypothetical protein
MYGIFRIKDDDSIVIDKNAVLLIPELVKISEKELRYIILVYDWFDSPLRKMPYEMRCNMAKRRVWGNIKRDVEKSVEMIKAIDCYKSICYDPVRESIDAIKLRISLLNKNILDPTANLADSKKNVELLEFYEDKLYNLENEVKKEEAIVEIKGKKNLSNLELWQRRQQEYRKIKSLET